MATPIDISMFDTDALKLSLFYALIKSSVSTAYFMQVDLDLSNYSDTLRSIKKGYIDYFNGRVFKADISGKLFDAGLYNRDNGQGAAERIVSNLREQLKL